MNQNQKTLLFVALAVVALLLAIEPWAGSATLTPGSDTVVSLFPKFKDPLAAKSLQIVQYDQDTGKLRQFVVKQGANGEWVIPSNEDYPADAREHMAAAATTVLDLESLNKVSSSKGEFEVYGVIDPDPKSLTLGTVGVGTRITLKDAADKPLADLIVGKKVKDQQEQRYVRVADHDQVYVVKLNIDKLSTKFGDWIEKDLLKLNAFDVRGVELNDYSMKAQMNLQGGLSIGQLMRSRMKLDFDEEKSQWKLANYVEYDKNSEPVSDSLKDDEELNTEKLNGLKTALDDLQIVDVERKPKGLSQDLRVSEDFVKDEEAIQSLAAKGFFPLRNDRGGIEIYSSEGEVLCTMKDGIEYTLRFGNIATNSGADEEKADDAKDKTKKAGVNRYLFVTCRLNEDLIPKPQLEEAPGEAAEEKGAKPEEGAKPEKDAKTEDGAKPDAPPATQPPSGKQGAVQRNSVFKLTAADEKAVKKPAADDAAPAKPSDDDSSKPAADAKDKPAADAAGEEAEGGKIRAKARDAKALAEKKAAAEKENQKKLDDYNEKVKKAQERTAELNGRFADWYYVISDDVYHKIHLSRADVVKKKETAPGKGDKIEDFKALEKSGLPGHDHDHDHEHDHGKAKGKK